MRLKAQGFFLLTIAFSSALTFSVRGKNGRPSSKSTSGNFTEVQTGESQTKGVGSSDADHGLDKRSAEIFPQALSAEEDKKHLLYEQDLTPKQNTPDRRTLLAFGEKRPKKEYSGDDYCARAWRARLEGALNKRFLTSFGEALGGKRTSMAFHGMRGKKSRDYGNDSLDPEALDASREFLISTGLLDETEPWEFSDEKRTEEEPGEDEGVGKRSPYAFQGMRGKKEYDYDLKRAMGFLGMRGKKATDVEDYKRAPQTSFFGMKGKKAQSSGFFGMRGKKASPNGFFGIKGKREPSEYDFQDLSLLNQMKESGASNNRFRRGIAWLNNSKKAKNAFFGIRGKKSIPEKGCSQCASAAATKISHLERGKPIKHILFYTFLVLIIHVAIA